MLRARLCAIPALAAAALWGAGCGTSAAPTNGTQNVVLVVVDTLGAEHVSCYGASDDTTPNLDRLASRGLRFERAYSTAPWTQPSIASLFTSTMPLRHGVRNLADRLHRGAKTLAEELRAAGLQTHGIVSHFLIDRNFGFAQGFQGYDARAVAGHDAITAAQVTDAALRWLEQEAREPFFLFVHYFDPHFLYHHHAEFDRTEAYQGPLAPGMPIWDLRDMRPRLTAADVEYLVALYREEIAFTDHHLGRLLEFLERTGVDRRTLFVFTADHGEEFMRHGWIGHTRTLYDELLHVPLVLYQPGVVPPGVIAQPVSLLDVLPTVVDLLGIDAAGREHWEGSSLAPLVRDPEQVRSGRAIFAEVSFDPPFGDRERTAEKKAFHSALVLDGVKLIHDRLDDRWELYEHATDREELDDRWGDDPVRDAKLRRRLLDFEGSTARPERPGERPNADELRRLRELGYAR